MNLPTLAGLLGIPDLADRVSRVEAALKMALATDDQDLGGMALEVVQAGGKRLRPVLTLSCAEARGVTSAADVVSGAVAMELVHVGTLVHDDIIDHATDRRGVPTINAKYGVNFAILAGDYLLGLAGREGARVSKEVAAALAEAVVALCEGQTRETLDQYNPDRTVESYYLAIRGKTSALMRASCEVGARCSSATAAEIDALARFGEEFGLAFQIVDDVLDIESTFELMGKAVGSDVREGVYTLPVLLARDAGALVGAPALGAKNPAASDVQAILDAVRASGAVEEALTIARRHNHAATAALKDLPYNAVVEGLRQLPGKYLVWAEKEKMNR